MRTCRAGPKCRTLNLTMTTYISCTYLISSPPWGWPFPKGVGGSHVSVSLAEIAFSPRHVAKAGVRLSPSLRPFSLPSPQRGSSAHDQPNGPNGCKGAAGGAYIGCRYLLNASNLKVRSSLRSNNPRRRSLDCCRRPRAIKNIRRSVKDSL